MFNKQNQKIPCTINNTPRNEYLTTKQPQIENKQYSQQCPTPSPATQTNKHNRNAMKWKPTTISNQQKYKQIKTNKSKLQASNKFKLKQHETQNKQTPEIKTQISIKSTFNQTSTKVQQNSYTNEQQQN